jgi:hypothetical protein
MLRFLLASIMVSSTQIKEQRLRQLTSLLGWSYGLSGKLAKAPRFENMDTFDAESNSLFKVHVHIDDRGFVWVNLDGNKTPVPWKADFSGADKQPRLDNFNMDDYSFDHAWDMNGNYNWKTLVDNYNEVYHTRRHLLVACTDIDRSAITAQLLILVLLLPLI